MPSLHDHYAYIRQMPDQIWVTLYGEDETVPQAYFMLRKPTQAEWQRFCDRDVKIIFKNNGPKKSQKEKAELFNRLVTGVEDLVHGGKFTIHHVKRLPWRHRAAFIYDIFENRETIDRLIQQARQ